MGSPRFAFVLSPWQNVFFHELAEVLVNELRSGGADALLADPATLVPDADTVFVLLPPHEYVALEGDGWLHEPHLLGRTIGLTAEQPNQAHFSQNATILTGAGAVFDFSTHAVDAYRALGVRARHLRFGYTEQWDRFRPGPAAPGPPEVLFMGNASPRRQRLLARSAWALARRESRLVVSDNATPNRSDPHRDPDRDPDRDSPITGSFLAGDAKRDLLARSRLLLNLHQAHEPYFEWLRFIEAFHCGVTVLSEPSIGTAPFEPGRHFLSTGVYAIAEVLDRVVDDDDLLQTTREEAYACLRDHPLIRSLDQLIGAGADLLDRPVPTQVPAFTRQSPIPHPLSEPLELDTTSDESVIRQSLREIRLDMQGLRREVSALREQVATGGAVATQPGVTVEVTTPAYRRCRPATSVIMALYNHADYVVEALDSMAASDDPEPFEILVVDDGSTDRSRSVVHDWMVEHPHVPAQLIAHRVNRGLPFARNTALGFARGRYCFVLDADNAVYPPALRRLRHALEDHPAAAFSYGMLEVFDAEGPAALLDIWPWQPWRLASGNYIDAMALIRTAHLRDLGGYTTDRRLYGWEDYDVWCRTAEQGGFGVQVSNIVARYRLSATSMVSLSNVSEVAPFAALAERCPRLMHGALEVASSPSSSGSWT
jgi:hypothetical protein